MTFVGLTGILLGLFAWPFAMKDRSWVRMVVFFGTYVVHLAASFTYYLYSKNNVVDATDYYHDYWGFGPDGFGVATQLIYFVVQSGRNVFGGTLLDYFLLFQTFGFFGLCMMMRIFEEIFEEIGVSQPAYVYCLLFLPGLHFWTSAIGKDAPLFFGICCALWASMDMRKRYIAMAVGVAVVLLIRPHIGLVAAAAVAGTLVFDRATRLAARVSLVLVGLVGLAVAAATVESTFQVDVTNADSLSDFLSQQEEVTRSADVAGNTAVFASYPIRLLSLLFRPLFFDADEAFGYIASIENLGLLIIMMVLLVNSKTMTALVKQVTFIRFTFFLSAATALLLALVYYNVGLGLRQKTMFTPGIIVMFVTVLATRRMQSRVAEGQVSLSSGRAGPSLYGGASP